MKKRNLHRIYKTAVKIFIPLWVTVFTLLAQNSLAQDSLSKSGKNAWYSKCSISLGWLFTGYTTQKGYYPYDPLVMFENADGGQLYKNAYHEMGGMFTELAYTVSKKVSMAIGAGYSTEGGGDYTMLGSFTMHSISFYWQGNYFLLSKKSESPVQPFIGIKAYCILKQIIDSPAGDGFVDGHWFGNDDDKSTILILQLPVGISVTSGHVTLGSQVNFCLIGSVTGNAHLTSYSTGFITHVTQNLVNQTMHYDRLLVIPEYLPTVAVKAGFNF